MNHPFRKYCSILACLCASAAGHLSAQSSTTGPGPTGEQSGDTSSSSRVTITETPIEESVLPTARPYTSAFGLDNNILDVPRNVTIISREQLDTVDIQDVRDFSKLTSSSYTTTNFGAPSNPSIRGQIADTFTNGLRTGITSNGNGLPIDFNAIESVSILKGPAPVIYGPSPYVGGFVNFVTKQPYFDKWQGFTAATVGEYSQNRWTGDVSGPLIPGKLALRISYSGEESGSYYDNGHKNTEALYMALTATPFSWYTASLTNEFYIADYTENFGFNRPTQNLIDNNQYIVGTPLNSTTGLPLAYPAGVQSGFNFIPTGTTVNIGSGDGRKERLFAPGDGSLGRSDTITFLQTAKINDHVSILNSTLGLIIDRTTRSSYRYQEQEPNNIAIENRTEAHINFEAPFGGGGYVRNPPPDTKDGKADKDAKAVADNMTASDPYKLVNQINTGFDFRYQHIVGLDDFYHEPANAYDITGNPNLIRFPLSSVTTGYNASVPYGVGYATPGGNYGYDPLNGNIYNAGPDTNDSFTYDYAYFFQHQIDFGKYVSLFYGGRGDLLYVSDTDPAAPVGFKRVHDSTVMGLGNANVSPVLHVTSKFSLYATFNYNQATEQFNGGGIAPASGGYSFSSAQFHNESELYEAGFKASLVKDTLFINGAIFRQTRNTPQQTGANQEVNVKGVELEANYQPNRHFYATAGYTFLSSYYYAASGLFESTSSPVDVGTTTITLANGQAVTGKFTPDFYTLPTGNYRQPGVPQHLFNFVTSYKTDFGLGASLDGNVTSTIFNDYGGQLKIPWQYTLDASIFYTFKNVQLTLAVLNFTDQKNWAPPNPTYGNDSILADLPLRVEGTVKIRF